MDEFINLIYILIPYAVIIFWVVVIWTVIRYIRKNKKNDEGVKRKN